MTKRADLHLQSSEADDYVPLVRAAAAGDESAMERLLMRAQQVAFRFSLLVCGQPEDAEDVMQDALLRTYRHVHRISKPEAFRAWLFKTVRNACLMKRRRRVDEPAHLMSIEGERERGDREGQGLDIADRGATPESAALNGWLGRRLRRALAALPTSLRVIVLLREMEGLSTREVSEVTGLSEANVKTRLHRARVMLRKHLEA